DHPDRRHPAVRPVHAGRGDLGQQPGVGRPGRGHRPRGRAVRDRAGRERGRRPVVHRRGAGPVAGRRRGPVRPAAARVLLADQARPGQRRADRVRAGRRELEDRPRVGPAGGTAQAPRHDQRRGRRDRRLAGPGQHRHQPGGRERVLHVAPAAVQREERPARVGRGAAARTG
ncbi:MAG: hypothetical protein AVDCRST_MAG64-1831, partial [uncultured Phycisphaerae bacterium]